MKELEILPKEEYLKKNFIKFNPNSITNEDNNIYVFRHIITSIEDDEDGNEIVNMTNDIKTIHKLKNDPIKYYIEKRSWDDISGISNKEIINIILIVEDKYNEYVGLE